MWKTILLFTFVSLTVGNEVSYTNYKLYYVVPQTEEQLNYLNILYKHSPRGSFDFWKLPTVLYSRVEIMVSPQDDLTLKNITDFYNISTVLIHDNIQQVLDLTTKKGQSSSFDFTSYHTLDEIYQNLDDLTKQYPNNTEIIVGGETFEKRQIKGIKISFNPNNPGVFLEGGIDCREWMTSAVVMYLAHQILNNTEPDVENIIKSYNWFIFPSFNPDGYVYTHTTDRLWKKTRSTWHYPCFGADPNKNWGYKWNTGGSALFTCCDGYPGRQAFSEIETKSMADYIDSIEKQLFAYFSFYGNSYKVIYPAYNTMNKFQYNADMVAIGKNRIELPYWLTNSEIKRHAKFFLSEDIIEMNGNLTSGSSVSYIKGKYHKPLVLAYGLQNKQNRLSFLQAPNLIVHTAIETFYSLTGMLKEAEHRFFS